MARYYSDDEIKDIKGYEGLYGVTEDGKVYSYTSKKFLKRTLDIEGYEQVILYKNKHRKTYKVHRLVALAYIPNPNNFPQVNHRDENKTNNNVSNLEWCTAKYNSNYGTRTERIISKTKGKPKGKPSHLAKKIIDTETGIIYDSLTNVAEISGIHINTLRYRLVNNKCKYKYYEEGK